MITRVTEVTEICTKQDMSRWTRAHADAQGITWSVIAGPGGTMIIVEHEENRSSLAPTEAAREPAAAQVDAPAADARMVESFLHERSDSAPTFA